MFGFKRSMIQAVIILIWANQYCSLDYTILKFIITSMLTSAVVLTLLTYDHDYWADKGVFAPPASPLVGHIWNVVTFKEQVGICFKNIYDTYRNERFLGTHQFFKRTLVIRDPELFKRICVNDFHHFTDRGFFYDVEVDPLALSVLTLRGNEWKRLRAKISPIFSPNKLRGMFHIIDNTANEFLLRLKKLVNADIHESLHNINGHEADDNSLKQEGAAELKNEDNSTVVDCEKLVGGYTADAIVPCAFGLKSNVMDNPKDPFAVALHAFYEMSFFNVLEKTMRQFWPAFVLFFKMRNIPKTTHDFFCNIVMGVLRDREKGAREKRGDFIDMMMALRNDSKNNNSKEDAETDVEITDMVISANAFIIFLGGYETTSATLAFLLLEIAAHPPVQEKMRREVEEVLHKHGHLTYEALQELNYMEMVIQETLRLYPPFPNIQRMCTKDYTIPDTSVVVEKGTIVLFPILAVHRDEQYFENADAFIPERWADLSLPPGVYIPFGDGPRYCIGKRFALVQMKCCLVRVLQHVRVGALAERSRPFGVDHMCPLTLHPADSKLKISLL